MEIWEAVEALPDRILVEKFKKTVTVIQRTMELYGLQSMAFSFNGGKDSTVLLQALRAAIALQEEDSQSETDAKTPSTSTSSPATSPPAIGNMCTFVFGSLKDFPEITKFVEDMDKLYGLNLKYLTGDFKVGVQDLVSKHNIKAFLMGTRRGDPDAVGQDIFSPSSPGWPPFMRVNPVLHWTYSEVWAFLRATKSPYCTLYDQGFTSIGSVGDTQPNQSLIKRDGSFAPAFMLADTRLERAGRVSRTRTQPPQPEGSEKLTRTAAVIIIGDEILDAKVDDINTHFLAAELRAIGWQLRKVVMIPDEVATIASEIRSASESFDLVLTSGGLGPTLDDVTMAGLAEALGCELIRNSDLESRLRDRFGADVTEGHLKMAEAPQCADVELVDYNEKDGAVSAFPIVKCGNIFVLPGIPDLLQAKWSAVRKHLTSCQHLSPFRTVYLRLALTDETKVTAALEQAAAEVGVQVKFGSYPVSDQKDGAGIVLSLDSKNEELLEVARKTLVQMLPSDLVTSEDRDANAKKINLA